MTIEHRNHPSPDVDDVLDLVMGLLQVGHMLQVDANDQSLCRSHLAALYILNREGTQSPTQLRTQLMLSQPAVSALIKQMTAQELVSTHPDRFDGRRMRLMLTTKGFERLDSLRASYAMSIRRMLAASDDELVFESLARNALRPCTVEDNALT